jgi:hypothetical protein
MASPRPTSATTTRSAPAGTRRVSKGPTLLPARTPRPNGTTAAQRTGPQATKTIEQATSATPSSTFLRGVSPREMRLDGQREHRQGHHARSDTPVAVEQPHRQQSASRPEPAAVTGMAFQPRGDPRLGQQGQRGEGDQERNDPREHASGGEQQQRCPAGASGDRQRRQPHDPLTLALAMELRADPRADPGRLATKATVSATLAGLAGRPTASSTGYEIREAMPPAEPTSPATTPAASKSTASPAEIPQRMREPSRRLRDRTALKHRADVSHQHPTPHPAGHHYRERTVGGPAAGPAG